MLQRPFHVLDTALGTRATQVTKQGPYIDAMRSLRRGQGEWSLPTSNFHKKRVATQTSLQVLGSRKAGFCGEGARGRMQNYSDAREKNKSTVS